MKGIMSGFSMLTEIDQTVPALSKNSGFGGEENLKYTGDYNTK